MKKRALFIATAVLCLAGNIAAGQTKAETVSQEKQAYEYSKEDENGNTVNETITDEQIAALGKSLGVPEDITITRCNVSEPWFWEGAGRWLVSVELYSDDIFLAELCGIDGISVLADFYPAEVEVGFVGV